MVRIIERVAGRYDVREMEWGRVYRWCPERVVLSVIAARGRSLPAP